MKTTTTIVRASAALLCLLLLCLTTACTKEPLPALWESATYTSDQTLGSGAKSVTVEVKAGEKSIHITLKTDKDTLGDALLEQKIVEGEASAYGLYIKVVNGIKADYDTDGAYWSLYKNGEYATSGADTTTIADGEHYELVYTK